MMSRGRVFVRGIPAGIIEKVNGRFVFTYDDAYRAAPGNPPVSLTLPKTQATYSSDVLFPFFYGLLAEGDLKTLQCQTLKIDENDHFTRLLKTGGSDVIGAVTVEEIP